MESKAESSIYVRWIAIFLLIAALYVSRPVLIPIFAALFLAILLDPVVVFLERFRVPRGVGAIVTLILFLGPATLSGWGAYRAASLVIEGLPAYTQRISTMVGGFQSQLETLQGSLAVVHSPNNPRPTEIQKVEVVDSGSKWTSYAMTGAGSLFQWLSVAFFVPLLFLYFLIDKENLRETFHTVAGKFIFLPKLNQEIPRIVRAFFIGNFVVGVALSCTQGLVYSSVGLQNPWSLGLITGFVNLIPLLGAPMAMILPVAQILSGADGAGSLVLVCSAILVLHWIAGNVILPQIIGPKINVSAAAMLTGLMFWGWLWGAFGFLFAIPLTALIKILLEANSRTFFLANLLAARPQHITE